MQRDLDKEKLKKRIESVIQKGQEESLDLRFKSIDELVEEVSVYHQELQYQNQELMRVQRDLDKSENKFKRLFYEGIVPYIVYDEDGMIELANKAFIRLMGLGSTTIKGHDIRQYIHPNSQDLFYLKHKSLLKEGMPYELDLNLQHNDLVKEVKLMSEIWDFDDKRKIKASVLDMTETYSRERKIHFLSFRDQLTGLYNRRFYEEESRRMDVPRNYPISIVMADMNGLKLFNDAFGHETGDSLLKLFAYELQETFRQDEVIARIGGDEFVVLLPKCHHDHVQEIILRLHERLSKIKLKDLQLSIAIGHGTQKSIHEDLDDVLKRAENRMYQNKIYHDNSKSRNIVLSMLHALHEKNSREEQHSQRVAEWAILLGKELGFDQTQLDQLKTACQLHDIGKIAIDYSILDKAEPLTLEEYEEIQNHPAIGYRILKGVPDFASIADLVLCHHERMDGLGYPKGLKANQIPLKARIIAIVDAYDAMVSKRPYRPIPMTKQEASQELLDHGGQQFDEKLVTIFVEQVLNRSKRGNVTGTEVM